MIFSVFSVTHREEASLRLPQEIIIMATEARVMLKFVLEYSLRSFFIGMIENI